MSFTLRIAKTKRDLELVALLDYILFVQDGSPGLEPTELFKDVVWWLAYAADSDTQPVGFCGMTLDRTYETSFVRAGTLKEYRRKGLQKQMIAARLKYAKRAGYRKVLTYVHGDNVASQRALLSCGFVPNRAAQSKRDGLWLYVEAKT